LETQENIQNQIDSSERVKSHFYTIGDSCYIRLSPTAWKIFSECESGKSFADIAQELSLQNEQIVSSKDIETSWKYIQTKIEEIRKNSNPIRSGFWLRLPLIPESLVKFFAQLFQFAFNPLIAVLLSILIIIGSAFFYVASHKIPPNISTTNLVTNIVTGYVLYIFSIFIHELGHSSACLRFGAKPNAIGFTLYLVYPAFYSDVSDAWRLKRWQRVIVDTSGLYFQFIVGAIFSILWFYTEWQPFKIALYGIFASTLFNLNPILRFDGYWILCDIFGVINLGGQPIRILKNLIMRLRGQQPPPSPWTSKVTIFLAFYSVAWFAFFIWFIKLIYPFVVSSLVSYPQLIKDSFDSLINNHGASVPLFPLLVSTFIIIVLCRILWVVGVRSFFRYLTKRFSSQTDNS
jgi:putative peptide zinc metalloprotease protein